MESIEKEKTKEEIIKEFVLQNGASVVGVASVEEYNEYVPKFHRPVDILPGARSFIVLGGSLPFLSP